jgi:hypothetical protein
MRPERPVVAGTSIVTPLIVTANDVKRFRRRRPSDYEKASIVELGRERVLLRTGGFWQGPVLLLFLVLLPVFAAGQVGTLVFGDGIRCDRRLNRCAIRGRSIPMSEVKRAYVHSRGGALGLHWVELETADGEVQIADGTAFSQGVKQEFADAFNKALRDSKRSHFELERSRGLLEVPATAFLALAFAAMGLACLFIPFRRLWDFELATGTLELRQWRLSGRRVTRIPFANLGLGPLEPGTGWWQFVLELPQENLVLYIRGDQGPAVYRALAGALPRTSQPVLTSGAPPDELRQVRRQPSVSAGRET